MSSESEDEAPAASRRRAALPQLSQGGTASGGGASSAGTALAALLAGSKPPAGKPPLAKPPSGKPPAASQQPASPPGRRGRAVVASQQKHAAAAAGAAAQQTAASQQTAGAAAHCEQGLWVQKHAPASEAELVVHKKKVQEVREWLEEQRRTLGTLGVPRLLVVSGPSGCGKSAVLRVLAAATGFDVSEWRPPPAVLYEEAQYAGMQRR